MRIMEGKEKIIFTAEEIAALQKVQEIFSNINEFSNDSDLIDSASDVESAITNIFENDYENVDFLVETEKVQEQFKTTKVTISITEY